MMGSAINNVNDNVIDVIFQPTKSRYFNGPTKPPNPNPALYGVPTISKYPPSAPKIAAVIIIGKAIVGFIKKLRI